MKVLRSGNWLSVFQSLALLGAVVVFSPTAASAQTNHTDVNFLGDLYSFLESQNDLAHYIATSMEVSSISRVNAEGAQEVCDSLASGMSAQNIYNVFMSETLYDRRGTDIHTYEEIEYAVGLYFGSVMNLGSAYYCPNYHADVVQALRVL